METKKQNNELKKVKTPIMVTDAWGFVYRKEDQSSSSISFEEREALLDSWK